MELTLGTTGTRHWRFFQSLSVVSFIFTTGPKYTVLDKSTLWCHKGHCRLSQVSDSTHSHSVCLNLRDEHDDRPTHLIQTLKEAVFVLRAPRLPLPTGPLLVTSLLLLLCWPLSLGHFGHSPRRSGHRPRLAHHPLGGRAILCPCTERRLVPTNTPVRKHFWGKKAMHKSKRNTLWYDQNVLL